MTEDDGDEGADQELALVLDVLAHGRSGDDRPQYEKEPLAYVLDQDALTLFELTLHTADVSIGDEIDIYDGELVRRASAVDYDDLPGGASSELEYVIEDMVTENEQRHVDVYNEAGPITLRLHQLNLLPGIGEKLRNDILDERKRRPFQSFEDIEARIDGLHNPREIIVERMLEEIRDEDLKYRLFAGEE